MTRIRRVTADDVPRVLSLIEAYWELEGMTHFHSRRVELQLKHLLSEPKLGAGWMAEADGEAVGYVLVVYVFSLEHLGLTAEIDEFFVAPGGRNSGVGSELLKAAESEFKRLGCTNISLQVACGNDGARRFYYRHGFEERSGFELMDKMLVDD